MMPGSGGGSSAAFPRWSVSQRDAGLDPLDPSPLLLPGTNESPAAYLERLQGLHRRLGALIATIEQRREMRPGEQPPRRSPLSASLAAARPPAPVQPRPAPPAGRTAPPPLPIPEPAEDDHVDWPAQERRVGIERRIGAVERRIGLRDRRHGAMDERQLRTERRNGPRDRRIGSPDRRRGLDRRGDARREPWQRGGFRLDRTLAMWLVQVSAWIAIAVVALVYGLGHS